MPFRKPDASDGDASTYEGALAAAERRAGRSLSVIDPLWARAWIRLLRGEEIWPSRASREPRTRPTRSTTSAPEAQSIWSVLGVSRDVTESELKAAYRRRALETHPDHGGDEATFRRVLHAYVEAQRRLERPRPKPRRKGS